MPDRRPQASNTRGFPGEPFPGGPMRDRGGERVSNTANLVVADVSRPTLPEVCRAICADSRHRLRILSHALALRASRGCFALRPVWPGLCRAPAVRHLVSTLMWRRSRVVPSARASWARELL